jgi:SLT domain-containing protein
MGLLDKVKEQAATASAAAKEMAQKGQAKLDETKAKRKADGILRNLGAAYYAQWTKRGDDDTPNEIERLVAALQSHEEEYGQIDLTPSKDEDSPDAG